MLAAEDGGIDGPTLLKQMGRAQVDVASCVAEVEAAALQAAFEQTDRVSWEWGMREPVNASMFTKHGHISRMIHRQLHKQG